MTIFKLRELINLLLENLLKIEKNHWKLLKKFKIVENQRIEKIGKNLRRGWKKKKKDF